MSIAKRTAFCLFLIASTPAIATDVHDVRFSEPSFLVPAMADTPIESDAGSAHTFALSDELLPPPSSLVMCLGGGLHPIHDHDNTLRVHAKLVSAELYSQNMASTLGRPARRIYSFRFRETDERYLEKYTASGLSRVFSPPPWEWSPLRE